MKKKIFAILISLIIIVVIIGFNYNNKQDVIINNGVKYAIKLNGKKTNSFPSKGKYNVIINCNHANAKWDYDNWKINVYNINEGATCDINFTSMDNYPQLNDKIISLKGNGQVFEEQAQIDKSTITNPTPILKNEYASLVNDATNPWTWNKNNKTWTSSNHEDSSQSSIEFSSSVSGAYQISYSQSSENNYDYGTIYKNGTEIKNLKGETDGNFFLGQLTPTDKIKITYKKDGSGSTGSDTLSFSMQSGTYNENIITATDYRYEGKSPDNYIWFNNELWRIIGVFDSNSHGKAGKQLVKIIRNEPIGNLIWNKPENNWATARLQKLLNGAYLNAQNGTETGFCYGYSDDVQANCDYSKIGIQSGYREMIENVTWYLGGRVDSKVNAAQFYQEERDSNQVCGENQPIWTGKIGLMYISDYGYSVMSSTCNRSTRLYDYCSENCAGQSWLYGYQEWTITQSMMSDEFVFNNSYYGVMFPDNSYQGHLVRPVLYLKSNVYTKGGDGTLENPYVIGI